MSPADAAIKAQKCVEEGERCIRGGDAKFGHAWAQVATVYATLALFAKQNP